MTRALAPSLLSPLAAGTSVRADSAGSLVHHDGLGGRWVNTEMGLGGIAHRTARATFEQPFTLPVYIIDAMLQFNGVARRLCEREPYDCTREGFTIGTDPLARVLHKAAIKWGILKYVRRARAWARAYGGSAIVLLVDDGRPESEPLDEGNVRRVLGARVLHRWELSPMRLDPRPGSQRAGLPEIYQVTIAGVAVRYVHHTRVLVFQGFDLPDQVLIRQLGWGGSVFDLAWAELRNWQVTMDLLPEFASRMTQGVYTQKYLGEGVAADLKTQIVERFEAMQAGMSVLGDITIAPEEKYEILARPSGGIQELGDLLVQAFIAAGDMPRVILMGETPGGLRSGSDSPEVTAWYDHCAGQQPEHYTEPVTRMLELIARSSLGPTRGQVPELEVAWLPLYQPSQTEIDASDLSRAQRRSTDVTAGVITVEEARTDPNLRKHYQLGTEAPATPGIEPTMPADELLDDEAEAVPVVSADASQIPEGESLIPLMHAARRLGNRSGAPLMRLAAQGAFPIWRIGGRWKVAWSQVAKSAQPHAVNPLALQAAP